MTKTVTLAPDSPAVVYLCKKDKRLAKIINKIGPVTYEIQEDSYYFLVSTIVGQMLSNKVADVLIQRLLTLCSGSITPDAINSLTNEELRSVGISNSKVGYIRNLTSEIAAGNLQFQNLAGLSDKEVLECLTSLRGIGKWSAKMYLIFILNRQDVLPLEDVAFLQTYCWLYKTTDYSAAAVTARCKKWRPYSSVAARYFYIALDSGLTKEEFHLYK